MIIGHKYRYVFIEIPITGSYAIRNELSKYYDGHPILHKHASYPEFQRVASDEERNYFVFATVRNPLDIAVSGFFKLKTDHKSAFSNPEESIESHKIDYADVKRYEYIKNPDVTFEAAFLRRKLWERPYSSMIELSTANLDFVIRYENLQQDFAEALRLLGIEQARPIPIVNKTQGREANWETYYATEMITKAKRVYGPFMKKWGYEFPESWGDHQVSRIRQLEFGLVNYMQRFNLIHLRYNDKAYARFIRKLRAHMVDIF